jgi:hypothetical protein
VATNNKVIGGKKLDLALKSLEQKIVNRGVLRVGFLEKSKYPDGTPIAQVAFWNEFGTIRSPSRPFFRTTVKQKSPEWGDRLAKVLPAVGFDGQKALAILGQSARDDIESAIAQWASPPNAPSTIKRKGFDKPLVDKGLMQRAVDYEVVAK